MEKRQFFCLFTTNALHAGWLQWGTGGSCCLPSGRRHPLVLWALSSPVLPQLKIHQLLQLHNVSVSSDDTTQVSVNKNYGVVSLLTFPPCYLGCEQFRAALFSCFEYFHGFGWKESCSYHGLLLSWCWARLFEGHASLSSCTSHGYANSKAAGASPQISRAVAPLQAHQGCLEA